MTLCWDRVIGLIMQNNLKDPLRQSVDQKVALFMESHEYQIPLSQEMLHFVDATQTEKQLAEASRRTEMHSTMKQIQSTY